MGGSSSKQEQVIVSKAAIPNQQIPQGKPNIHNPSPVPTNQKAMGLQQNQSFETDSLQNQSRPAEIAKQSIQIAQQQQLIQQSNNPQVNVDVQARAQALQEKENQRQIEAQALKKKQAEDEKIRQLQIIREQQKAKLAAEQAQAQQQAALQQQQLYALNQQQSFQVAGQQPANQAQNQQFQVPSYQQQQFQIQNNNPKGQDLAEQQTGKPSLAPIGKKGLKTQQNLNDQKILGNPGLRRNESIQYIEPTIAPAAQIQFKIINYDDAGTKNNYNQGYRHKGHYYDKIGSMATTGSNIHIGMMDQNQYKTDADQNRNIDMNELHQLLGN